MNGQGRAFGDADSDFLLGGGEMGERMREKDWSETVFGPVDAWPHSLKTSISLMLASRFALVVAWGPEFRFFYNDRYRPVLGASKHPGALGARAQDIFPEAWPFLRPLFESTRQGESIALDDVLIPIQRYGYLENCYFTLSYSPIRDETGGVGGMLAVVVETTERVEGERRLRFLRELARRSADAKTPQEACDNAAATISQNTVDIPFALFYVLENDGDTARLASSAGISPGTALSPGHIRNISQTTSPWPFSEILETRQSRVVDQLPQHLGAMPGGPYDEPANTAVVAPLYRPGQPRPDGVVIFGVSPRRALDDSYRVFFDLATDHILSGLRNALAYQEERKRAEALAELDRAKTTFFSNVSHEFRTPLTLMLTPLQEVLDNPTPGLGEAARGQIEVAHRNSLRLLKLVNTLLDFARIEAERMDAVYEPVDLAVFTEELASVFRSTIERAGLEFVVDCQSLDQPVYVDRTMWEKIVFNLLSNAFKFTFNGSITVRVRQTGTHAHLTVIDTGAGIPSEEMPHLFERFHRVRGARGRTYEGTGIGLALVQELVRLQGGTVSVASDFGIGSTFEVRLPLGRTHLANEQIGSSDGKSTDDVAKSYLGEASHWSPDERGASRVSDAAIPGSVEADAITAERPLVLLADDNHDMRDYVKRILSPHFRVTAVSDGEAAIRAAQQERPDLILSDIMMPRLDGLSLLRRVRDLPELRTTPVILVSARAGEEARIEGRAAGADDYIVKPFSARELTTRVESHLQMAKLRRDAELTIRTLKDELQLQVEDLRRLHETTLRLTGSSFDTLFHELLDAAAMITGADKTYVALFQQSPFKFSIAAQRGFDAAPDLPTRVQTELGVEGARILQSGRIVIDDLTTNSQVLGAAGNMLINEGLRALHSMPLVSRSGPVLGIFLILYAKPRHFANRELQLLDLLARLAADMIERAQTEEAHKRSEERLRLATKTGRVGVWDWDIVADRIYWTDSLYGIHGVSKETFPGDVGSFAALVHPDDSDRVRRAIQQSLDADVPYELEFRAVKPEGEISWVYTNAIVIRENGRPIRMLGATIDITERRRAEAVLRSSEERERARAAELETLMAEAPAAVFIAHDPDARTISGSRAAYETLRMSQGANLSLTAPEIDRPRHFRIFIDGVEPKEKDLPVQAAARGLELRDIEEQIVFDDGSTVHLLGNAVPLRDSNNNVRGSIATFVDISERKRAEQHLAMQYEVARIVANAGPINEAIDEILHTVGEALGWDVGAAWRLDLENDCLECITLWRKESVHVPAFESATRAMVFKRGIGLPGRVWETFQPAWIESLSTDSNFPRREAVMTDGLSTGFAFPIIPRGTFIGVVEFFKRGAHARDNQLLQTLTAVGNQVGLFMQRKEIEEERSNLLASERSSRRQLEVEREILETVNRSGQMLSAELDLRKLVQALTDAATEITGAEFGSFFYNVLDERGASYMLYTLSGVSREHFAHFPMPRSTDLFGPTFRGEGTVRIDDVKKDARYGKNAPYHGMPKGHLPVTSYLAVSVTSRSGAVIGGLFFGHSQPSVFTARHERIVEGLAGQAAIAIDNARLFESAQRARSEAEIANRLKDDFLATVSHELRTPLNAILGWARLLRGGKLDETRHSQALEIVERNAVAQQQIIEDILDVSRIVTGKLRLDVTPVEVAAVVEAAVDSVRPSADAKGVRIQCIIDSSANLVLGDSNRLQQIVWNLLSNAVKFTPQQGRVQVTVERINSHVEITVRDTGKGISRDFLPFVFERFRQADSSSTRQYGGLGLGLAIVRHLAELHGGTAHAFSPGEGQGSTFTVRLPLAIIHGGTGGLKEPEQRFHQPMEPSEAIQHGLSLEGLRVLAVDDETDARDLLTIMLTQCRAQVKAVSSTQEAMELIRSWKPHVLISDIGMPGDDGYSLIRQVRALPADRGGTMPAAALTAYARSEDRVKALAAGYQTHVTKPVDPSELIAVVASLAGRAGRS